MSLWESWFIVCQHVFSGCTVVGVVELVATILTAWSIVMIACVPYYLVRGRRK